jgi:predicted phage terminase large subunit-like protein
MVDPPDLSLPEFFREGWHAVEGHRPLVFGWHLEVICEYLEAVTAGEIRKLAINIPPRSTKSTSVSVLWPAWTWIRRPEIRWLFASYHLPLSIRDLLKARRVIQSPWYQARWGSRFALTGDQNTKLRYDNDRGGFRMAASVDSGITGEGGDIIVYDDPHNVREAESEAVREATIEWYDQVMATRKNDPATAAEVLVMQRVHEADLAGHVLAEGGWEHLCLPMEYEPKRACVIHRKLEDGTLTEERPDPRTEEGELLCPERFGPTEIADFKRRMGSRGYAGQMQQRPAPAEGGILKTAWFQRRPLSADRPQGIYQFWDTAFTKDKQNDMCVCGTFLEYPDRWRLTDLWFGREEFSGLKKKAKELCELHKPRAVVIESKSSGIVLLQEWRRESRLPILGYNPDKDGDKVARAYAIQPLLEAGKLEIPTDAPWVDAFLHQCTVFPNGDHDDMVDVLTSALINLGVRRQQRKGLATMDFKVEV